MVRKTESAPGNDPRSIVPKAVALTIAGSDPSGGAGLQADLKTFQQLGVYGMSVVTLITVQNTQAVEQVEILSPTLIAAQLETVLEDIPPRAIKTGALGNASVVKTVGQRLADVACPIVVDPVLVSKHGHSLVSEDVVAAYQEYLLPHATLVTPNRFEAQRLTGLDVDNEESVAEAIYRLEQYGVKHVLLKLGEIDGQSHHVLSLEGSNRSFAVPRLPTDNTHGTGCILSAAITAKLALGETDIQAAVLYGIRRTFEAIHANSQLGRGVHPAEIRAMFSGVDD
jgi:hydroxymethylpyrimidine/phosphomethylpyrimidine kinase